MAPVLYAPNAGQLSLVGKGSLWLDRFDQTDTASGTMISLGNCDKFGITVKPTVIKEYNSMSHTAALAVSAVSQVDITVKISGFEFGPEQIALAMQADLPSTVTQMTATVSAEVLAAAGVQKHGRAFVTANREISAVVVTQSTTTLVAGTDYVIKDAHLGLIYFPEGGAVVDTAAVTVAYTAAAIVAAGNMRAILGASVAQLRGKLIFIADPMKGPNYDVVVPRVMFASAKEMDFIGTTFGKWELDGDVEDNTPYDPTIPYFKATRRA